MQLPLMPWGLKFWSLLVISSGPTKVLGENQQSRDLVLGLRNPPLVNNHTGDLSQQLYMINLKSILSQRPALVRHLLLLQEPTKPGGMHTCPLYHQFRA